MHSKGVTTHSRAQRQLSSLRLALGTSPRGVTAFVLWFSTFPGELTWASEPQSLPPKRLQWRPHHCPALSTLGLDGNGSVQRAHSQQVPGSARPVSACRGGVGRAPRYTDICRPGPGAPSV